MKVLTVDKSLELLNIPIAKFEIAESVKDVERLAKRFGFPVVLKLISPKVIHKTEAKGVTAVRQLDFLRETAEKFLDKGKVLVQEHCSGVEFFLGIKNDPSFGHVLLAGVGGIFVEVFKDVSFRVCPVNAREAESMLDELKGKQLLEGFRGMNAVDKTALINAMVKLSKLPEKLPNLEELDVNPLFVNEKEVKAVDARLVLRD